MMLIIADSELTEQEKKVWMRQKKKKKTFFLGFVNLPADGKIFKFINSYYCVCATDYWADLKHLRLSLQSVLITEESLKEIWSTFIMYAVEKTWLWTDFLFLSSASTWRVSDDFSWQMTGQFQCCRVIKGLNPQWPQMTVCSRTTVHVSTKTGPSTVWSVNEQISHWLNMSEVPLNS